MKKEWIDSVISITIIIFLFVFFSYIIKNNLDFFKTYLDVGFLGMSMFVILLILSVVFVPFSAIPLFPLASGVWGWITAGALGVIGWTVGSVISFLLARKYGVELVRKVLPIKKIYDFEKKIPEKNLFWTVVIITMVLSIDGIGYVFGLFSKMKVRDYTFATLIGLIPFSFVVAYLGGMSFDYTIIFFIIGIMVIAAIWLASYFRKKIRNKK